jgi:Flp pilus assembly protein CpaB
VSNTTLTTRVSGRMSSRGWAIALGIGAIALAAVLLVVYLNRYRARVGGANLPTPVLVAKQVIRQGTPGNLVTSQGMYQATELPRKEVDVGAIADPQYLTGRAAAVEVLPGQQLTEADFAAVSEATVDSQISGTERALSISLDNVHASLSQIQAGDFVDTYVAASGEVCLFKPNVKVLAIPTTAGPSGEGNLVLRVDSKDAPAFAFAADNTQLWFVLRPVAGAKKTVPGCADLGTVTRGG